MRESEPRRAPRSEAIRRCLASGKRRPKEALIRLVVDPDGLLVPDLSERLPGRGLWIAPQRDMIAHAQRRRLFAKAAKSTVRVPEDLADQVEALMRQRCLDSIALARRAGEAVAGQEKVRSWLGSGRVAVLLEASDASEGGRKRMIGLAKAIGEGLRIFQIFTAAELGKAFGRDTSVHVALAPGGLATKLRREAARFEEFMSTTNDGSDALMERHGKR